MVRVFSWFVAVFLIAHLLLQGKPTWCHISAEALCITIALMTCAVGLIGRMLDGD